MASWKSGDLNKTRGTTSMMHHHYKEAVRVNVFVKQPLSGVPTDTLALVRMHVCTVVQHKPHRPPKLMNRTKIHRSRSRCNEQCPVSAAILSRLRVLVVSECFELHRKISSLISATP